MRVAPVLILLGVLACAARSGTLSTTVGCPASFLQHAAAFDTANAAALAGAYELSLIGDNVSSRGYHAQGRLLLWVRDSVRRSQGMWGRLTQGRERLLGAAFERMPKDTSAQWRRMASRDLNHPGGVYAGGTLRLGDCDGIVVTGDDLHIERADSTGFRGRWVSDLGIAVILDGRGGTMPNPSGTFCARRIADSPPP